MIFTSYFSRYKGMNGVSVANKTPDWTDCSRCKDLMPPWELVQSYKNGSITWKEFRKAYIRQLKNLDVDVFYKQLNGKVLLCWETTEKHCHRHIIREWFIRNGYDCRELEADCEEHTCSHCKSLNNHYSTSICCEVTGEIMTNADQLSKTCEDWRNRSVRNNRY